MTQLTPDAKRFFIPFEELTIYENQVLGTGSYGSVMKGKYQGVTVAIKRMHAFFLQGGRNNIGTKDVINEVINYTMLRSPHITTYYGYSTDPNGVYYVVTKYVSNGSLEDNLMKCRRRQLTISPQEKLQIALDVAYGLKYLHSRKLINRDLKPKNILVTKKFHAKICDFGLSRTANRETDQQVGTAFFRAPEIDEDDPKHTYRSDIYSFGVVLFSLFTEKYPNEFPLRTFPKILMNNKKLNGVIKLMKKCCIIDPLRRCSLHHVITELEKIQKTFETYERKSEEDLKLEKKVVILKKKIKKMSKTVEQFELIKKEKIDADEKNHELESQLKEYEQIILNSKNRNNKNSQEEESFSDDGKYDYFRTLIKSVKSGGDETFEKKKKKLRKEWKVFTEKSLDPFDKEAVKIQKKQLGEKEWSSYVETNQLRLSLFKLYLPQKHQSIGACFHNIGLAYRELRKYDLSLEYCQKSLIIDKEIYEDENNLEIANSYDGIASVYFRRKDYSYSLNYRMKGLKIYETVFGKNHEHTLITYGNIGRCYERMNDLKNAEKYYKLGGVVWKKELEILQKKMKN